MRLCGSGQTGVTGAPKMQLLTAVLAVCALARGAFGASNSNVWCYHDPSCNDLMWPTIFPDFCNQSRQSPIDIISSAAVPNRNLTAFTFTNFNDANLLDKIENTGRTVKVGLKEGIQVSGGDLSETYDALQFHLHWGNKSTVPGSEHTVDGRRFPMELHIVTMKSSYNRNTSLGIVDPEGFAALGFFIEESSGNETGQPAAWNRLSSYLTNITLSGTSVSVAPGISLDDLLEGVNRTKYYRYHGSLTTPACFEAVVWTVFKDTIKVSKDLIDLFSCTVRINTTESSPFMVNVYRNIQAGQEVTTQEEDSGAGSLVCSLGLIALSLVVTWS